MHLNLPEMDQGLIINNGLSYFLSKTPGKVRIIKKRNNDLCYNVVGQPLLM